MRIVLAGLFACMLAPLVFAAELVQPSPDLAPETVIETQLDALRENSAPSRDSGIRQVWEFAHPDNRRMTGPFERFASMIKGPYFNALVGHASHTVKLVEKNDRAAAYNVEVISTSGRVFRYRWVLQRAFGPGFDGAWMTVSVSIPEPAGRAL